MVIANFITDFLAYAGERLKFSVEHMSIPQWGIVVVIAMGIGFAMMRSQR